MLRQFVNIINTSESEVIGSYLLIRDHVIVDLDCLNELDSLQCINSFCKEGSIVIYDDLNIGDTVTIEFSLLHLNSNGYYETFASFILKNQYSIPAHQSYYIKEIDCFNTGDNAFLEAYISTIKLIDVIKNIAKHCYSEAGEDFALIAKEDKALLLPFKYLAEDIQRLSTADINSANKINEILGDRDLREKIIFVNELIDFLVEESENDRFQFLLSHIVDFEERYANAYEYYIRDFSYNKLKGELDNAALDYVRKIQSLINDAQTKLIAIPTAFVLATTNIDFIKITSNKNIGIICSLFIFSWLLDLFVKNQKSALGFILHNISQYKKSFSIQQNEVVSNSFTIVDNEIIKQKTRLNIVHWITWGVPLVLFIVLILIYYKYTLCSIFQK